MKRYQLFQGKNREHPEGKWVRYVEVKRLQAVVCELEEQRGRLEQFFVDYQPGTPEFRLAEALLDALDVYQEAAAAGKEGDEIPMREIICAEEIVGTDGYLANLECGHRIATSKRHVRYPCRECAVAARKKGE